MTRESPTAGSNARWTIAPVARLAAGTRIRTGTTLDTKWTGSIRPEVFQMPRYAPYREAGNFKMPFWLQPKHYYAGPAWYRAP